MLIRISQNQIVNTDHIVDLKFLPAEAGDNDGFGQPYNLPDRLVITTTAVRVREVESLVNAAAASESQTIELTGEEAVAIWNDFSADLDADWYVPPQEAHGQD